MKSYKDWEITDEIPENWSIDKTAGSTLFGHVFITNNKSLISGQRKTMLYKINNEKNFEIYQPKINHSLQNKNTFKKQSQVIDNNYVKTVNELARQKFKQKLLSDILVDLMICEIEGWSKTEYLNELKELITNIGKNNS